jgi:hypothetical protein
MYAKKPILQKKVKNYFNFSLFWFYALSISASAI